MVTKQQILDREQEKQELSRAFYTKGFPFNGRIKKKVLIAKRMLYGKKSTPTSKREYKLVTGGPVGTKKEWRQWSKQQNIKIIFKEK